MKNWLVYILIASVCLNIYQFGKDFWTGMYIPNKEDRVILGEMVQLVVQSADYQKLIETEDIYAITTSVDRNKGGVYPFYYSVTVQTGKESYLFFCEDKTCSELEVSESSYSPYSEEEPVLPLRK